MAHLGLNWLIRAYAPPRAAAVAVAPLTLQSLASRSALGDGGAPLPSWSAALPVWAARRDRDRRREDCYLFKSSSAQNFVPETSAEAINPLLLSV